MLLIINLEEFIHLTEQSCYNNNYYKHKITGTIIYEHCDEFYNICEYYDETDPNNKYYLGWCFDENKSNIEIKFKEEVV